MATFEEIQEWVRKEHGFDPKPCWIADVQQKCGLPISERAQFGAKQHPCPPDKRKPIEKALKHYRMIE